MSDSDDFEDDDAFMDELMEKTTAINRQVSEKVITHNPVVQRTLTGERLETEPVRYEEIRQEVMFHPTHHELNVLNLTSYVYPSNYEVRDYQFDIIKKALFTNLLCAIPTGMGKTFVASTVMLNYYRWFKKGKIIFMAPTRPLVAQQIQACLGVTDIPSSDTAILLDKSRKNRPEIWNSKRVFFTTPQVVENDLKTGILNPKEIVCLVIDEAHRARGNYAYTNVVQFIYRFNTSFRVLALTATPASDIEGVQDVVNNLKLSLIEIRTEESPDIVKYMKNKENVRINVGLNSEMEDIIELLTEAIDPILKQANEANIYDVTDASRISHFAVLQKSQSIIRNPTINEGVKWKYYFMLQVIGYVGQMIRRLKIYGVRTFYSYFQNKCKEFKTKYSMGKSTNKLSATFFYHNALKQIEKICFDLIERKDYISHPKLEHLTTELVDFFQDKKDSRVIVFTELRESALEIVKCVDSAIGDKCKPHIFIGQARGKEGFDEDNYKMKNGKKGRGKQNQQEREDKEREIEEGKEKKKKDDAARRANSSTGTSEEAQLQGMNQKLQKELIKKFKKGEINVLVATSIGEEGLDIGEVDLIICYDSTSSPIKNIQRMGRTGRKNDGKVILLLAASEGSKFDQSMSEYASVQRKISENALDLIKSDRILPNTSNPTCIKKYIDIPEDNLIIARGEDEDEVIKYATQAMLGKNLPKPKKAAGGRSKKKGKFEEPPKPTKRFFMPDNVATGFANASTLVRKVGDDEPAAKRKQDVSISLDSDDGSDDESLNMRSNTSVHPKNTSISLDSEEENDNDHDILNISKVPFSKKNTSISLDSEDDEKLMNTTDLSKKHSSSISLDSDDEDFINISKEKTFKTPDISRTSHQLKSSRPSTTSKKQFFRPTETDIDYELPRSDVALPDLQVDWFIDKPKSVTEKLKDKKSKLPTPPPLLPTESIEISEVAPTIKKSSEKPLVETLETQPTDSLKIIDDNDIPKVAESPIKANSPLKLISSPIVQDSDISHQDSSRSITKAELLKDLEFELEVSDSEDEFEDNDQSFISYNRMKKISTQTSGESSRTTDRPLHQQLLDFTAFEDDGSDAVDTSNIEPYNQAKNVNDIEYEKDPEFNYQSGELDSYDSSKSISRPSKRAPEEGLPNRAKSPKLDISSLLKQKNVKKEKKVEYIDLISQSQNNQLKQENKPKKKLMPKKDSIYPNEFTGTDGFIDPIEIDKFYTDYYSDIAVEPMMVNPTVSCKRYALGKIKHSSVSTRFKKFCVMGKTKRKERLDKLNDDLMMRNSVKEEVEESTNDDKWLKVIVKEDDVEYLDDEVIEEEECESDQEITKENSISSDHDLLSEDDADFMNL